METPMTEMTTAEISRRIAELEAELAALRAEYGRRTTPPLLERKVSTLDLSVRAANCLKALGVVTLGDLTKLSGGVLLRMPNFGIASFREVEGVLRGLGLQFVGTQGPEECAALVDAAVGRPGVVVTREDG
jgi:DNA-directed RNA polymerase alpha subunit